MKKRITALLLSMIMFVSTGMTSYAAYTPKLLKTVLSEDSTYSSRYSVDGTFKVDLFDYDPVKFNTALGNGNNFKFVGYETGVNSNGGVNDSTATYAKQGIVKDTLVNGYPVFNYVDNGTDNALAFFSDTKEMNGKTIFNDVNFEFVYDNVTGYYEYKSSANHAQYNRSENKVELYADSLCTVNAAYEPLDLSTATVGNALTINSKTETTLNATTTAASANRYDPYFNITVPNVKGSDITEIYLKVNIPAEINTNQFKVYFTTTTEKEVKEENSFKVEYTPTGKSQIIRIKTSGTVWQNGIITSLRIDPFDNEDSGSTSDSTAIGSIPKPFKSYNIEISDITLLGYSDAYPNVGTSVNGGFYPFSNIQDSYKTVWADFSLENWSKLMKNSLTSTAFASRAIGNPNPTNLTANLAYGLVMEFDFYIPVNGTTEDLTYYFNGDDDLWVFVDNKLVLDIGGGHGAISGTINFTKGISTVEKAVKVDSFSTNEGSESSVTTNLSDALTASGKHTMKVFYLERCGSVSNCHMKFNLPRTPEGSVVVSKTLDLENYDSNSDDSSIRNTEEFEFTIETKYTLSDSGNTSTKEPYVGAYYLTKTDGTTVECEIKDEDDGKFKLKDGELATFTIDEGYDVTVTETQGHAITGYDFLSTTTNDKAGYTDTIKTTDGATAKFNFVNSYKEQSVTYTYIPINPDNCIDTQKGTVELTGDSTTATCASTGVQETVGVRLGNPKGSTAADSNAVKFVGWYSEEKCEKTSFISNEKILTQSLLAKDTATGLWTGGTYYAKFEPMYGDLKISKSGISDIDNHEAYEKNKAEQQSTIYRVYGTSYSGETIDLQVAIVGNSYVTIKSIPTGEYTVTEDTDWAWRYTIDSATKNATIEDQKTTETAFENTRSMIYWLSGDAYCENNFGAFN